MRTVALRPGETFTEQAFDGDRQLIADILRDEGHADANVHPRATIDPVLHRAYVVFVLEPGPMARFGSMDLYEGSEDTPIRHGLLPQSHFSADVAVRATGIHPGDPYSRTAVAHAQRWLFDTGVFGIVRINEEQHECDSHDRCDAARDRDDPVEYVRVDLKIHVAPARSYRIRAGFGIEADQTRTNIHLLASYQHYRIPLFGRLAHLTVEDSPLMFLPITLSGIGIQTVNVTNFGNALLTEFRVPEVWKGGALVAQLGWDFGPDPINPAASSIATTSARPGVLRSATRHIWYRLGVDPRAAAALGTTPIRWSTSTRSISALYGTNRAYVYLEQTLTYDGRDSIVQTHRGVYASLTHARSRRRSPAINAYTFVRRRSTCAGTYPSGSHIVFAARGYAGAAAGLPRRPPTAMHVAGSVRVAVLLRRRKLEPRLCDQPSGMAAVGSADGRAVRQRRP